MSQLLIETKNNLYTSIKNFEVLSKLSVLYIFLNNFNFIFLHYRLMLYRLQFLP